MKKLSVLMVLIVVAAFLSSCAGVTVNPVEEPKKTEKKDILSELSAKEYEELNKFMSIIYKGNLGNYSSDNYTNEQLLNFTLNYFAYCDYYYKIISVENEEGITSGIYEKDVNEVLEKFLGKKIACEPSGNWKYKDGLFYGVDGLGGDIPSYSIVTALYDNGNGTYDVEFSDFIYYHTPTDEFYSYTAEQAMNVSDCEFVNSGSAVIKNKMYNGVTTYELIGYNVTY